MSELPDDPPTSSSTPDVAKRRQPTGLQAADLDALRREIDARIAEAMPERWNPCLLYTSDAADE